MTAIFCIIDGMTDEQWTKTECEMSNWNDLRRHGVSGFLQTTPYGQTADSVSCMLRLLGYGGLQTGKLRGWIEALGCGISFASDDLLLRASWMNLDGRQCCTGFAAQPLDVPAAEQGICYNSLGGYKAMLVVQHGASLMDRLQTTAPHQHFGAPVDTLLPKGDRALAAYLQKHRTADQILLPWGEAVAGQLPKFPRQACFIAGCSTALGLGRALQIPVIQPAQATGDVDTNLSVKVAAALQAAQDWPLVILHINGADEAGHRRNNEEKRAFLQQVDQAVFARLRQSGHQLLLTADHGCSPQSGRHLEDAQPFVLYGTAHQGELGILPAAAGLQLLCGEH